MVLFFCGIVHFHVLCVRSVIEWGRENWGRYLEEFIVGHNSILVYTQQGLCFLKIRVYGHARIMTALGREIGISGNSKSKMDETKFVFISWYDVRNRHLY